MAGCACAGNAGNVFPRHRLQRKPLVSDPGMHHGIAYPRLRGKRSRHSRRMRTHSFTYLARGPWIRNVLTHWGRVTHICVSKLTIISSDNGLSSGMRQVIIWTNAEMLLIGPLGINFNEIFFKIRAFSFKNMHFIGLSAKWRQFCLGLNALT